MSTQSAILPGSMVGRFIDFLFQSGFVTLATVTLAVPSLAQDDAGESGAAYEEIEEIIVTGSRIARRDYQSASPIVTVDASLFDQTGATSVEAMLNTLPQFAPWFTENTNNRAGPSSGGQAVLDLRGMGLGRTLVLLDGRRIVPSNPWGAVDVNLIPPAVIGSVEIITGGASAVYGSDAMAGVVNFKTRKFKGLEADVSWGQTAHNDGTDRQAGITGGLEFVRGYAYGHLSYAERDPVIQGDRDFSEISLDFDRDAGEFVPSGSWVIRQGLGYGLFGNLPDQGAIDTYFSNADPSYTPGSLDPYLAFGFNPDGSPFSYSPVYNFTGDMNEPLQPVHPDFYSYNYAPDNYLRTPAERTNFFGRAGVSLSTNTELFLQLLWASYTADQQLAPTPMGGVYVGANNPFIHPELATLLESRPDPAAPFGFAKRMTDIGPRIANNDYSVLQALVGINGSLSAVEDWRYEIYGSWGDVDYSEVQYGNVSKTAFEELSMAPDAGASICGGQGMNPFGINSISTECAAHFLRTAYQNTTVRQLIGEASFSGPVFEMPAGSAEVAVGVLYKKDEFNYVPDEVLSRRRIDPVYGFESSDVSGFNPAEPVAGNTTSREIFLEAKLPLLVDAPLAQYLDLTIGYRYADHSTAGGVDSYKGELIWQINRPVSVRSSMQHAVRAPDFVSLFRPQVSFSGQLGLGGEPCEFDYDDPNGEILGAAQDPEVAALCVAQGIPESALPSYVDADSFIDGLRGGNPALHEEAADTFTLGVVFQSPWEGVLKGLQVSIDYFDVEMTDVIGYAGFPVYQCYDRNLNPTLDLGNFYCRQFDRDPVTHEIINVLETAVNLSVLGSSGYDIQVDYLVDAGPGQLRLHGVASYIKEAVQQAGPGVPVEELQGKTTYAHVTAESVAFTLVPQWKFSVDTSYAVGGFDSTIRWRYIDSVIDGQVEEFTLPSRQYLDLTFGYAFKSGVFEGFDIRAGVTNFTDEQPVVYPSSVEANTESSVYDVLGRRYFVRATYVF